MSLSSTAVALRGIGIIVLLLIVLSIPASAQTTAFHYQGRLNDSTASAPTTGTYDFQFTLWDSETNGCPVGTQITITSVAVTAGVFSTDLDFGNEFPGADRWLEIAVKKPTDGSYTTLTPRQKIASVPYAIRAANVNSTSGNSIVTALNDSTTTDVITADKISDAVVKIGVTEQTTVSNDMASPMINIKSVDSSSGSPNDFGRFKVGRDGSLLASGQFGAGGVPASGPGARMMWYPGKIAFRAGYVGGSDWDEENIGMGSWAGGVWSKAQGDFSFALGYGTSAENHFSFSVGSYNRVNGMYGLAFGYNEACSGYHCLALGTFNRVLGDESVAIGADNVTGGMGSFALGNGASTCKVDPVYISGGYWDCPSASRVSNAFVWADSGPNWGATSVIAQADREFRARATGGFRLRTSDAANNAVGVDGNVGCDLDNGSSVWTCASSRSLKENFTSVNGEDILGRLRKMPMTTWSFINESGAPLHLGPVAEDFYEAFKLGKSDKSIGVQDLAGVSLAATKALEERTAKLQAENDALRLQISDLAKRLEKIEKGRSNRRSAKK